MRELFKISVFIGLILIIIGILSSIWFYSILGLKMGLTGVFIIVIFYLIDMIYYD